MRIWLGVFLGILLIPLILGGSLANAATVSGRSSTVLEWYDTPDEETAVPIYQYLQLRANDLGADGYNFKLYGRLAEDINNEADIDSRLYYAYLENREVIKNLGFRLGRQFISTTAGASILDGLSLDYRFKKDYKARVFVGGDVAYYEGYNAEDIFDGFELSGNFFDNTLRLEGSYVQKWDESELAKDLLGFSVDYDVNDNLWLYNELQYDVLSERISYSLLGGKYRFNSPFTLRTEYLYSLPVFSSTSIYSVFAVDEYEEVMAELTWKLSRDLQLFSRYTREIYQEYADSNVFEVGVEKLRTGQFSGYLAGIFRDDDDGQSLYGAKAYGNYQVIEPLRVGAGLNVDVLERDIAYYDTDDSDQNETTSTRIWIDAKYDVSAKMNLTAKYEYIESDLWDYYNRGTIRLNILF